MSIILIDVDYVTLDLHTKWLRLYNADYSDNLRHEAITAWAMHTFVKPSCGNKIYEYLLMPDLYEDIMPTNGAIDGIHTLRNAGHRVVFLSSGIHRGKYLRLKEFNLLDSEKDYICAHDKSLVYGDFLLDDAFHNVEHYKPGTAILYNAPHNQDAQWFPRVNNWEEAVQMILDLDERRKFARRAYLAE